MSDIRADLGEGPLWHSETNRLVWLDIKGSVIHFTDVESGTTTTARSPKAPGALAHGVDGSLVAGLTDGLYRVDDWQQIASVEASDTLTRSNDALVDANGAILMGTMSWQASPGMSNLYRIHPNGAVEHLLSGLTVSNGMAWRESRLLHVDTPTAVVRAYQYRADSPLGPSEVALDLHGAPGLPDGICIDSSGCLWVALWDGAAVHRYTPNGVLDTVVALPVSRPTSCAFGGSDRSTLFITTASSAASTSNESLAGSLFACPVGIEGAQSFMFG